MFTHHSVYGILIIVCSIYLCCSLCLHLEGNYSSHTAMQTDVTQHFDSVFFGPIEIFLFYNTSEFLDAIFLYFSESSTIRDRFSVLVQCTSLIITSTLFSNQGLLNRRCDIIKNHSNHILTVDVHNDIIHEPKADCKCIY